MSRHAQWQALTLADDLLGAMEVAAALAGVGVEASACSGLNLDPPHLEEATGVLVLDTQTRSVLPHRAAERLRAILAPARARGIRWVHKHADPTFAGNLALELCEMLQTFERSVVYAPTCPTRGLTCRNGELYLNGRPMMDAAFDGDPVDGGDQASLQALLAETCPAPAVATNPAGLAAAIRRQERPALLVVDGQDRDDVRRSAREMLALEPPYLTAGGLTLAIAMAEAMGLASGQAQPAPPRRRSLTICGSMDRAVREQVRRQSDGWAVLEAQPEALLLGGPYGQEVHAELAELLCQRICQSGHVLLTLLDDQDDPTDTLERAHALGLTEEGRFLQLAAGLGEVLLDLDRRCPLDALIVFGEDTLRGILDAMDNPPLPGLEEIHPGLPVCRLAANGHELALIAKAGESATAETLQAIHRYLDGC